MLEAGADGTADEAGTEGAEAGAEGLATGTLVAGTAGAVVPSSTGQ